MKGRVAAPPCLAATSPCATPAPAARGPTARQRSAGALRRASAAGAVCRRRPQRLARPRVDRSPTRLSFPAGHPRHTSTRVRQAARATPSRRHRRHQPATPRRIARCQGRLDLVIAEKFQAMVALGRANSRMKDFYDVWLLSQSFPFDDDRLARAIAATFERRGTAIPAELPDALTRAFAEDEQKRRQWRAFAENVSVHAGTLDEVIETISTFLMGHASLAAKLAR